MKTAIWVFGALFLLSACSGAGSSSVKNPYLGEFPSLEKEYTEKINAMEEKLKTATTMDQMVEFGNKIELLKEEKEQKMDAYVAGSPFSDTLPLMRLNEDPRYQINKAYVKTARTGVLNIEFEIAIKDDIPGSQAIYFMAVDSKGNYIPNSKTIAASFARVALTAGTTYTVEGGWRSSVIQNMEDFARIVQISQKEYEEK
jgi:hypothetical protein